MFSGMGFGYCNPDALGQGIRLVAVTEYYTVISRKLPVKTAIESPAAQRVLPLHVRLAANLTRFQLSTPAKKSQRRFGR